VDRRVTGRVSVPGEFKHIINRREKKSKEICLVVANEEQESSCQRIRNQHVAEKLRFVDSMLLSKRWSGKIEVI